MMTRDEAVLFYRDYATEKMRTGRQTAKELRERLHEQGGMLDVVAEGTRLALHAWDDAPWSG